MTNKELAHNLHELADRIAVIVDPPTKPEPREWWINHYDSCDVSYAHKSYESAANNVIGGGVTIHVREVLP